MVEEFSPSDSVFFVDRLTRWFRETGRDLPWRRTYDPYHVWISEIMLQQTQMERGVAYFLRWVERFPTVKEVAEAPEDDILFYWQGLGYYARARNLHKAAKEIVEKYSGCVPADYATLLTLPGVGPYTAAAVASIAGNQDVVVLDANVNRIFARVYDIAEPVKAGGVQKRIHHLADAMLPPGKARVFNQAMMDFGGVVCTPKTPRCSTCVVQRLCRSYRHGTVSMRPVVEPPKKAVRVARVAGVIICQGRIYLQKRNPSSVWGGLWEFPGGEVVGEHKAEKELDLVSEVASDAGLHIIKDDFLVQVQHQYTHHKVTLRSYLCRLKDQNQKQAVLSSAVDFAWLAPQEMDALPCPSGVRKVIEHLKRQWPEMFSDNYAGHTYFRH